MGLFFSTFCQKLHENEIIWTPGGGVPGAPLGSANGEWIKINQSREAFLNTDARVLGNKVYNPYQKVIAILGQTLKPFDEDNFIPAYGFGDAETTDEEVFSFVEDDSPCHGFEEVLQRYNEVAKRVTLSGPTSFAPIITRAMQVSVQS